MKYLKGVKLGCNNRMEDLKVYSSSDFKIEFEYETSEETQLVLHQLNKASSNSNEYFEASNTKSGISFFLWQNESHPPVHKVAKDFAN
jgi:hypothetical protein